MASVTPNKDSNRNVQCALLEEDRLALVRVSGRGAFANSMPLKRFASHVLGRRSDTRFIIDLRDCETMDSTFMGVLAGICIDQTQKNGSRVILVNANEHCRRLLKNLGFTHLLDMRTCPVEGMEKADGEYHSVSESEDVPPSKLDQICLTLQAHKDLVKLDEQNEVRFQAVIEYLEKSLAEEGGNPH